MATKLPGIKTGTINTITSTGDRRMRFTPKGDLVLIASEDALDSLESLPRQIMANPDSSEAKKMRRGGGVEPLTKDSARLVVGFNVKDEPVWRSGQVYLMCFLLREEQLSMKKNSDAKTAFTMFYAGVGAFPGTTTVSSERSCQFVFLNFGQDSDEFFDDMTDLAALLAESLSQESVMVEFTHEGVTFFANYIDSNEDSMAVEEAKEYLEENAYRISKKTYDME